MAESVPPEIDVVLSHDQISVDDGSFERGTSADDAYVAFTALYDREMFDSEPTVYAVQIKDSLETRLKSGLPARMVHVPGVPQDVTGPVTAEGKAPSPVEVKTDLFAFFDAETGAHLVTVYIGPE